MFGDCDQVMKKIMQCLLPDGERQQWPASKHRRMQIIIQTAQNVTKRVHRANLILVELITNKK